MKGKERISLIFGLTIAGTLLGYVTGVAWERYLKANGPLLFAVLGGIIGILCRPIYDWLAFGGKELNLDSVDIKVPFVGATLKVKLTDAHRMVGWRLFVESATRITTQPLGLNEGTIREALTSLYRLFDIARAELKSMPPSPLPKEKCVYTVESYAVRMLNDGLRQMLSRWHPRLSKWEESNMPESDWPLAQHCRADLESTRQVILAYTWGLGEMIKIPDMTNLLPPKPAGSRRALVEIADVETKEKEFEVRLSSSQRAAGWHIFVELETRIATQPLDAETGFIREALASLNSLFGVIRTELKQISPIPIIHLADEEKLDSVEAVSFRVLNVHL